MLGWTVPGGSATSLRALLQEQGAVGTEAALIVLKDSLRALAACHEGGLAHGDITPQSVIFTSAGQLRLVDVGLWTFDSRRLLARSTPFYLAPEQWSGAVATAAGDVYAATVMFFECLAGAPPFYANGAAQLRAKHEQSTPPVEVLPELVRELVALGLAKDPRDRPSARSLLAQLSQVVSRAAGSGWERRGRRELSALLAGDSALPDVPAPVCRSGGAARQHRGPVRLAAVIGGALALAAGLASPPLVAILPSSSIFSSGIFSSGGRSPVLAFPEPARDPVAVRVATNGQLADRALTPATKVGASEPVVRARPPALSIPTPIIQTAPVEPAAPAVLDQGSTHPGSVAQRQYLLGQAVSGQAVSGQSTLAPPMCTQELVSAHKPCAAVILPEQSNPNFAESTSDPSQASTLVELPVPLEVPVAFLEPVPVLKSLLPGSQKIQPHQDTHIPNDTPTQPAGRHSGGPALSSGNSDGTSP